MVLALEEGMDANPALAMAMVLPLVLGEEVVRTQGHLDRRHHPRGAQRVVSSPLARQGFRGSKQ